MRDFYIYWYYSTFYMLTFSYTAYMGFIGYLCAYTPKRKGKKNTSRREKEKGTEERSKKNK